MQLGISKFTSLGFLTSTNICAWTTFAFIITNFVKYGINTETIFIGVKILLKSYFRSNTLSLLDRSDEGILVCEKSKVEDVVNVILQKNNFDIINLINYSFVIY